MECNVISTTQQTANFSHASQDNKQPELATKAARVMEIWLLSMAY